MLTMLTMILMLSILKFKLHTKQPGGAQDRALKLHVLPLYYHYILEANKLENIDPNETILEGTATMCNIFRKEWL